jgi:hypothetical protein
MDIYTEWDKPGKTDKRVTILFTKSGCPECEDLQLRGLCENIRVESLDTIEGLALAMFYDITKDGEAVTPSLYSGLDTDTDRNALKLSGDDLVEFLFEYNQKDSK